MTHMLLTLLQSGYYADSGSQGIHYSAAMIGMYILIIVIGIAGYAVQARLQSVFRKYSKVQFPGGLTGAEVAEKMLRDNHIHNVKVTHVSGHLTDHFNPQTMTVNLSDSVYSSTSVAAAAVAAHECGHAVQHAQGYAPLTLRSQLVPRRAVLLDGRHMGHHPRTGAHDHHAERPAVLDRRRHDRHVGDLLAGHAARGVQRLGPRAGVAAGQPHDAGSAARSGERGAGLGRTHLSRSRTERRRIGSLLGLRNPRTARLIPG